MVPVFEAGRLLLLIKRYEEAARCFDFVARAFASREILNNAGVARALEAIELFENGELNVAYPFEVDADTRLRSGSKAAEHDLEIRGRLRERLLRKARDSFERARQKDPAYLPARVNLAAVADLQGDPEEAEYLARKAVRMARERGEGTALAHGLIVRGIARLRTGNSDGAREDFESAEAGAPSLARLNLAAVDGPAVSPAIEGEKRPARPESIGQATPGRDGPGIVRDPAMVAEVPAVDRSQPAMDIYARQTAAWSGLLVETGYSTFSFLETRPGLGGETAGGIRIGDDLSRVLAAYGRPAYVVAGRRGAHHVYAQSRIVFRTDESRRVEGWTLYAVD